MSSVDTWMLQAIAAEIVAPDGLGAASRSAELHADAAVPAPHDAALASGRTDLKLEAIRHADRIAELQTAARIREVAHRAIDNRSTVVEDDLS
jgi:hypothetical protein